MDKLVKTLIYDNNVLVGVLKTTDMVNAAIDIHKLAPAPAAALGRTLTAATFMASGLKDFSERLSVTIKGNGLCGEITVAGSGALKMRGYILNPQADLPLNEKGKLDVRGVVGSRGKISVVKSMGLKEPYTGSCNLVSGEIAEDFAAYYAYSEQQPTAVSLGVGIDRDFSCYGAGGIFIQLMPGCPEEVTAELEALVPGLGSVSSMMRDADAEEVAEKLFSVKNAPVYYPEYKCVCSREYLESVLLALGKAECEDILQKEGKLEIDCQFCNKKYAFTQNEIDGLFEKYGK